MLGRGNPKPPTPRRCLSQRNARMEECQDPEAKEHFRAMYFDVAQKVFAAEILQNKKSIGRDSKIMYFFGSILHGLKRGTIKSNLSDFLIHANRIFNKAKAQEIKQIVEEYQRVGQSQIQHRQNNSPTIESHLLHKPISKSRYLEQTGKYLEHQNKREALGEINGSQEVLSVRRSRIVQEKQRILDKLGRLSNYTTSIVPTSSVPSNAITRRSVIHQPPAYNSLLRSQVGSKENCGQIPTVPDRRNEAFHNDDDKLTQLNNKLQFYIQLNQQHLIKSRTIRQEFA